MIRTSLGVLLGFAAWTASGAPVTVDGDWLQTRLKDSKTVVVDMTEEEIQYQRFHIPGAIRLDYSQLTRPVGRDKPRRRLTDPEFAALMGAMGIDRSDHIVAYDDIGGLNAGRFFMELERVRHPEVSVLDGGLVQWILDGRRVDNRPVERRPVNYHLPSSFRNNLANSTEARQAPGRRIPLLDVRTEEEYVGHPKVSRSGHIPGARWWPWDQSIRADRGFRFEDSSEIERSLARAGVGDKKAPVVLYCRTGHRASQTYLTLRRLGYEDVRLFAGSMVEYLQDSDAPVRTGRSP